VGRSGTRLLKDEVSTTEEGGLATSSPLRPLLGSAGAGGCCRGEFPLELEDAQPSKRSLEVDIGQRGHAPLGGHPVKLHGTREVFDLLFQRDLGHGLVLVMNDYDNTIAYFLIFVNSH
jgi:hypothetical protein